MQEKSLAAGEVTVIFSARTGGGSARKGEIKTS